jgi:hypothetical protein
LYFRKTAKADPDRNMSYSASVCSLSGQHSLLFQLLGLFHAISRHDEDAGAIQCLPTDTIEFEETKASQSDGGSSFTLSLYVSVKISLMVM